MVKKYRVHCNIFQSFKASNLRCLGWLADGGVGIGFAGGGWDFVDFVLQNFSNILKWLEIENTYTS